jgi:hypothetical protein
MTHRIVVDLATGTTTQVEYTAEEQAIYDAAVAAQEIETPVETPTEVVVETPAEVTPTEGV